MLYYCVLRRILCLLVLFLPRIEPMLKILSGKLFFSDFTPYLCH
uniref:Uncharacterized protein n=1 Tax=Siphoviridae sp. ctfeV1 TaxID=2826417 RepID=A0A8S5MRI6_9CAUD|nr:MAG TPA: hypothetical protein [Siphoviridae sp. ctfeV1]